MFALDVLKEIDPSFHVRSTKDIVGGIETICSIDQCHDEAIVFIKNKKYYNKLLEQLKGSDYKKDIGIIFQESFFNTINAADKTEFLNQAKFYATIESIEFAFSTLL